MDVDKIVKKCYITSTHHPFGWRLEIEMVENEKITINLGPVDLGKLDVLVEQGIFSNRSDAIRTAIRNMLEQNKELIGEVKVRKAATVGALILDKSDLEKKKAQGKKVSLNIIGILILKEDVTPELALEVFDSVNVYGIFHAPDAVKKALKC